MSTCWQLGHGLTYLDARFLTILTDSVDAEVV